jgi:hypothetical protein
METQHGPLEPSPPAPTPSDSLSPPLDNPPAPTQWSLNDEHLFPIVYSLAKEVPSDQCRYCWHHKDISGTRHSSFRCPEKFLRSSEWNQFKRSLHFPKNRLCFFCFSPYDPPFSHPQSSKPTPRDCEFPDALKEYSFLVWKDVEVRRQVFERLGAEEPATLVKYAVCLGKATDGGSLGVYAILATYYKLRSSSAF